MLFLKRVLIGALLCSQTYFAANGINTDQTESGLKVFMTAYDWEGGLWDEIEFDFSEWGKCRNKRLDKALFGPTTYLAEPLYMLESNVASNKIVVLGTEIGAWRPDETGHSGDDNGAVVVNVFKFPVMAMLIGNSSHGMLMFEKGKPTIMYIGRMDPKKWFDLLSFDMDPIKALFSTVYGALAGAASCLANSSLDLLPISYQHKNMTARGLRTIIDSIYFSCGCKGMIPFGTDTTATAAISTGILTTTSVLSDFHMYDAAGIFVDNSVRSTINGNADSILCEPSLDPIMPLTQYSAQMLLPTAGKVHPLGVSSLIHSFKNIDGKADKSTFFIFNKRREYRAGAYTR